MTTVTRHKSEKIDLAIQEQPRRNLTVMDLAVVIVNWHTCDLLRDCLRSVYGSLRVLDYDDLVLTSASSEWADIVTTGFKITSVNRPPFPSWIIVPDSLST